MKDVAKLAGVSIITVSRVINSPELVKKKTRLKVEEAIKELGFLPNHVARALVQNNTRAIYLYIPKELNLSDPFNMHLVAGVSEALSEEEYFFQVKRDLEFTRRCDGVIVMGLERNEDKLINEKIKVPYVIFGQTDLRVDSIDIDNYRGAHMMTEYLIENGHKRIGFLKIKEDKKFTFDRYEGYKRALEHNGLPFEENLIIESNNTESDGYEKSYKLLKEQEISALFCSSDVLAVGALRAAKSLEIMVPKDLSIGGFDGLIYDLISEVPLTTIRQPVFEAGKKLSSLLLKRIENPDKLCENRLITPELVIRNSIEKY
jgi:LacI family repressor for deo operon, udp, cdd, tsx, nupC, and nupG